MLHNYKYSLLSLGLTHKYKNQKKSEISDLGGEGGGEGVRRAENFWLFLKKKFKKI